MDKIEKFLRKLPKSKSAHILTVLKQVRNEDISHLDIKKLKNFEDLYRVRVGDMRIVFNKRIDGNEIIFIGRRTETTYKNLRS